LKGGVVVFRRQSCHASPAAWNATVPSSELIVGDEQMAPSGQVIARTAAIGRGMSLSLQSAVRNTFPGRIGSLPDRVRIDGGEIGSPEPTVK
jgi:hypothetical protein